MIVADFVHGLWLTRPGAARPHVEARCPRYRARCPRTMPGNPAAVPGEAS